MKIKSLLIALGAVIAAALASCDDTRSYAELLSDENKAVNNFLVDHKVVGYEKRDSTFKFEYGPDAPYYQLDEDAQLFMQVVDPGTEGNRAKYDQLIYMRFTRFNIAGYTDGEFPDGSGNSSDLTQGSASFRFGNFSNQSSTQWGEGIQTPLIYLPIDCEVNLIIKSQKGRYDEISVVIPYLYNLRYFKSMI
ncbi:MAG: DUF4827 domain-containing protein [Clostridium sp.]|nr:DUF4827 domain-containing protein [Clostridium sp.]